MSLLGGLLSFIPGVGPLLGMGADALSGMGKASAQNQGNRLQAAVQQGQLANQTAAQNDASRGSAWKNLLNADYTMNNNQGYQPATMHSSVPGMADRVLPSYGIARKPFGAGALQGAQGMQSEALARLQGGALKTPDLMGMAKPSMWQKILNVATPALTMASQFKRPGNDAGYGDGSADF